MASSSQNPPRDDDLQAALRHLKLNSEAELKRELLLKPAFVNAWRQYRDNFLWSPDARGDNEPTMESTIDDAVEETRKGARSSYVPDLFVPMDYSNFDERGHLICLIVCVANALGKIQSLVLVRPDIESFVKGMAILVRLLRFQYDPARSGRLARELDEAVGQSVHTNVREVFRNGQGSTPGWERQEHRLVWRRQSAQSAQFVYKTATDDLIVVRMGGGNLQMPQVDILSGIPGTTFVEREQDFTELVDGMEAAEREARKLKTQYQRRALLARIQSTTEQLEELARSADELPDDSNRELQFVAMGVYYTEERNDYIELFGEDDEIARYGPFEDKFGLGSY